MLSLWRPNGLALRRSIHTLFIVVVDDIIVTDVVVADVVVADVVVIGITGQQWGGDVVTVIEQVCKNTGVHFDIFFVFIIIIVIVVRMVIMNYCIITLTLLTHIIIVDVDVKHVMITVDGIISTVVVFACKVIQHRR